MAADKTRFRFRKDAGLRLLSHHDLARAFERLLRRADLPFESTGGFHPHARIVFPLAMPLGVVGTDEIVEIEWQRTIEPEDALATLDRHAPPGLPFVSARRIPVKYTALPRRVEYRLPVPPEWITLAGQKVELAKGLGEMWVERTRPRHKRIDIWPFVDAIELREDCLHLSIWVTGNGTAKADEICRGIGLGDLLEDGCWTRSRLEVYDELSEEERAQTPKIEAREVILNGRPAPRAEEPEVAAASWGASADGPITE